MLITMSKNDHLSEKKIHSQNKKYFAALYLSSKIELLTNVDKMCIKVKLSA